ncbi:NAC domain-containing protein 78 [Tripterygium wilfordii]|uniref:NAC domain-containing protein 78 n=1 Tax=Tripterygium wilfordii TaxID=458696 RepID=A0A7J7D8K1_TRIWF|nr:NAC domain-containing protein 53-like [Tripterygium wilfordii]KAF5742589.1 NAC domain-containing protein 78 [Tripterygium wilfordii]
MGSGSDSATSLAPGFRFHPTDEELVRYYLKRKVCNKPFRFDPISVIDVYRSEPWDLPSRSKLKSRDLEWYFFSALDKKYGNGSRTNRATEKGYWKTTGKDRQISWNNKTVGMKKTLVYHLGRAPRGERSNWVMHEYRLTDDDLEKAGIAQDAFVLVRIFQKSGSGPKNGEQYGAPFIEEEWDDYEEVPLPAEKALPTADEVDFSYGPPVEADNLEQNENGIFFEDPAYPPDFYYEDTSNNFDHLRGFSEDDQKPMIGNGGLQYGQVTGVGNLPPEQYEIDAKPVKDEYFAAESSNNGIPNDVNYLVSESYMDATDHPSLVDGFYLEANDLSHSVEADDGGFEMVDEYLNFFDAENDNFLFDPSEFLESDSIPYEQVPQNQKDVCEDTPKQGQDQLETLGNADASSSKQKHEDAKQFEPEGDYPFLQKASHLLEGISAPPAFASELPMKDAALRLNSASSSSSSVRVTAGIITIENMTWSSGKNGDLSIILSIGISQSPASLVPMDSLFSGKTGSGTSWSWFFLTLFWVLLLAVSFKVGTHICAN